MSDLARRRLAEIRTLRGWREAYKVAGLTDEGSDATKRRRLSRLINRETSGAKALDSKQRQKVNRAYRYRKKRGLFLDARVEREVKLINKSRRASRKRARAIFGPGGISPDERKLRSRLRKSADLTEADIRRIREAFESAEEDGGRAIRAEYQAQLSKVNLTSLPPAMRDDFKRRLDKATWAVKRDEKKMRQTTLDEV